MSVNGLHILFFVLFVMLHPVPEELQVHKDSVCACYTDTGCIYLPFHQYNKVSGTLVVALEFSPLLHFYLPHPPNQLSMNPKPTRNTLGKVKYCCHVQSWEWHISKFWSQYKFAVNRESWILFLPIVLHFLLMYTHAFLLAFVFMIEMNMLCWQNH